MSLRSRFGIATYSLSGSAKKKKKINNNSMEIRVSVPVELN